MFLLYSDLSSVLVYTIYAISFAQSRWICCGLWTDHYFSYFTFCIVCRIKICSTSAAHVPLVLSCWHNPSALAADFEQVIVQVICLLPCLLTRYWFASCQQHMCHRSRLLCIYGVLADFEQVIVPVSLFLAPFVN